MRTFFDPKVVVAACIEDCEHHDRAPGLLARVLSGRDSGVTSAFALAEVCAVKAAGERLCSWNARHPQTIAPEKFRTRIVVP